MDIGSVAGESAFGVEEEDIFDVVGGHVVVVLAVEEDDVGEERLRSLLDLVVGEHRFLVALAIVAL